jgi:hypothetical protein
MRATNVLLSLIFLIIFFLTTVLTFYMFRQESGGGSFSSFLFQRSDSSTSILTSLFTQNDPAQGRDDATSLSPDGVDLLAVQSATQPAAVLPKNVDIIFVGDVMLDRHIRLNARKNSKDYIFSEISPLLQSADLVVANLEGPITTFNSVSEGSAVGSPNNFLFTFEPEWVKTLVNNKILLVNLGNNHIWNFGAEGVKQTKQHLDEGGIQYFGALSAQEEKGRWLMVELGGMQVAFVSYNEFINGGVQAALQDIKDARATAELVVLYTHWGAEYQTTANQTIQNLAYQFVDAGADVIIGSHPHVVQQKEIYQGKTIYYSLGNFIFDQYFSNDVRKGLVVRMSLNPQTGRLQFREYQTWLEKDGRTILLDEQLENGSGDLVRS